jgi:hypothetical protein
MRGFRYSGSAWLAALACVGLLALAGAEAAAATDYCVSEPVCVAGGGINEGTSANSVQTAFEAAEKHTNSGGPDRVLIGAGTYSRSEGFSYGGDAVLVRGAGTGATVLTRPATSGPSVLIFSSSGSTVQGTTVLIPASTGLTGVTLSAGTLEADTIEAPAAIPAFGLSIKGGVFTHGTVDVKTGTGVESQGGEVLYSTIAGGRSPVLANEFGVQAYTPTTLRGDRISGGTPVFSYANPLILEDSLIDLGGTAGHGVQIVGNINGKALAFLRHVAIVNGAGGTGLMLEGQKENATALLENSIISEVEVPVWVIGEGAGTTASLSADYSSFDFAKSKKSESGGATASLAGEHLLSTLPSFVSPLTGDYRLAPGSPLIDAGAPGSTLGLGEFATDLAGNARIVNGRRDAGPYEYQWRAPSVTGTADRSTVQIGKPVSFSGTAVPVEPGDGIASYQWTFDDGATVPAGASAAHAFATPGAHAATLSVKDLAGLSSSAVVNVTATSLPVCVLAACAGCGGSAGEGGRCPSARTVRGLRIKPSAFHAAPRGGPTGGRRGGSVSYTMAGGVSLVSFTIKRVLPGVKSAAGSCVAPRRGVHGRSCTRYGGTAASFSRISPAGANGFRLSGRAKGKKLPPGGYVLSAHAASDPHGVATAVFRIVR